MAGKNPPRKRTKPAAAKPSGIAAIKTVEEITEAEREAALLYLLFDYGNGFMHTSAAPELTDDEAAGVWRDALFTFADLNDADFSTELASGLRLARTATGVRAECGDRCTLLTWADLAAASRAEMRSEIGKALNTTTPGGIALLDPDAEPRNGKPRTKVDELKETADLFAAAACQSDVPFNAPIDLLDPNPFQPRIDFNDEELSALAQSIDQTGLAHPLLVRKVRHRYQVADGERRWRACQQLGMALVPVLVRTLSDQQMAEVAIATAEQRAGLNPIEKARHFERLQREFGYTQDALGQRFGITQGQVSHTLRLLRLPAKIQELIMSRAIPQSHARHLVPWAEAHEDFWAALFKQTKLGEKPIAALEDWPRVIEQAANRWNYQIPGRTWCSKCCTTLEIVPTDEERAELAVVEIDGEQVATNRAAYSKLVARARREYLKAHPEKAAKAKPKSGAKSSATKKGAKAVEKGCTPAMLAQWLSSWRCWLINARVQGLDPEKQPESWLRFSTFALLHFEIMDELADALGFKPSYGDELRDAKAIVALPLAKLKGVVEKALRAAFRFDLKSGPQGSLRYVCDEDVEGLCAVLEVDLATAWKLQLAGPLTSAYLELHSREQLAELLRECGSIPPPPSTAKKEFIARLLKSPNFQSQMPRELKELIDPPKAAKTKANSKGAKKR